MGPLTITWIGKVKKRINLREGKLPKSFFELVKQEDMKDIWRMCNREVKDFTSFSARHNSFSRIGMDWETKEFGLWTKKVEIMPKIASDHNPLMWCGGGGLKKYYWRLNKDLLMHQGNTFLKKEINEYFRVNFQSKQSFQNPDSLGSS